MKITKYKIARVKNLLPEEDKEEIRKQEEAGELSSEMKSKIAKYCNILAPKSGSKTKGAFGKKGINRKQDNKQKKIDRLKAVIERQKLFDAEEKKGEAVRKAED